MGEEQMPDKVHDYMGYIMENLFLLSGTIFLNDIQVLDDLAVMANIATGIDPDLFKAQINRYGGMAVRIWISLLDVGLLEHLGFSLMELIPLSTRMRDFHLKIGPG